MVSIVAVIARLLEYYRGTWHLDPEMAQFRATSIGSDVVQVLVPIVITRGAPEKPPQQNRFLISQTFLRTAGGGVLRPSYPSPTRS
jgi:hypothetical protein